MRVLTAPLALLLASFIFSQTGATVGLVGQRMEALRRAHTTFTPVSLFTIEPSTPVIDGLWTSACRAAHVLRYNANTAAELIRVQEQFITLEIPVSGGLLRLELERARVTAEDFAVRRASDGRTMEAPEAVHYRGIIQGDAQSLVSISVFEEELMGIISNRSGQRIIGRFEHAPRGLHVLYAEANLLGTNTAACATPDLPDQDTHGHDDPSSGDRSTRCVRWYWEAAYDIFQNKGSVPNTVNYMTGLFNQSATIFANDGVDVTLLETFVWDVPSPYNGTSSDSRLTQFGTTRTSFNGDLAHLLDYGGYGGVAYLDVLCSGTSSRMAYSGINSSYNNVPTYSWSVNVVAHEQGHNLGSGHTHACIWNGNNTAIDGCGPTAGYTAEGDCPNAGLPVGGGTIMSYCHLIGGTGINFANGFGPQPKQMILDRTNAAACLQVCGTTCDAPGQRTVSPLYPETATLDWASTGASSYTLRWKAQSSGTWNDVSGLIPSGYVLTGISPSTAYEFQVLAVCMSSSSAFSPSTNFTTPGCDPPGQRWVNSLDANSAWLNWTNTGAVSYTLRWKAQASGTWNELTGITGTNRQLIGLSAATEYEFQLRSVCTFGSSAYSPSTNFTTLAPCPDSMEPNETWQTAAAITLPTSISALIASPTDQDHYSFTLSFPGTLIIHLNTVVSNYDLYLLDNTGMVLVASNTGSFGEAVSYCALAGTYHIRVLGPGGAYNTAQCYSLEASVYVNGCIPPDAVSSNSITYNSATVVWTQNQPANYVLRWKPTSSSGWTTVTVPGFMSTSYLLGGLSPQTGYDVQVRSFCSGSQCGSEYSNTYTFSTLAVPCEIAPPILLAAKLLLEGPYKSAEGLMTDSLRKRGVLPLTEPYTAMGFVLNGQVATTTTGVLATTGNNAIVDWVLVELREAANGTAVVERNAALVQRDGDVTAMDGVNPLGFCSAPGTYRVVVRHRNHNACMSFHGLVLNGTPTAVDFTTSALETYGTEARKTVGAVRVLWAGNTNDDIDVKYTGPFNDRDPILSTVGSTTPNNTVPGYLRTDVNMDGFAKYTGSGNDRDPILLNVGSTTPNNVRSAQIP